MRYSGILSLRAAMYEEIRIEPAVSKNTAGKGKERTPELRFRDLARDQVHFE